MDIRVLLVLFLLSGCMTKPDPNNGKPIEVNAPQAKEQCQVQAQLVWCQNASK